jgi:hypothetical protein
VDKAVFKPYAAILRSLHDSRVTNALADNNASKASVQMIDQWFIEQTVITPAVPIISVTGWMNHARAKAMRNCLYCVCTGIPHAVRDLCVSGDSAEEESDAETSESVVKNPNRSNISETIFLFDCQTVCPLASE